MSNVIETTPDRTHLQLETHVNAEMVKQQTATEIETHPHPGSNDMRTPPLQEQRGERPDHIPSTAPHHQDVASTFLSHEQFREHQEASRLELSDLKQTPMRIQEIPTQTQRAPIIVPYQAPQQGFNRPMNLVHGMQVNHPAHPQSSLLNVRY